ncbi:MAG: Rieske 2Fe-2S domain-containing protein [Nitrospinota bacterium]|nr:Rieske 2Fe-2S domain-containing protein [Nitrospinota bacterium]
MGEFAKVATVDELSENSAKLVEAGGKRIALIRTEKGYCAIDEAGPHRGGPLSEGEVEENEVICPWHGARFNVETGGTLSPPAPSDVSCYAVRLEGNEILIEI